MYLSMLAGFLVEGSVRRAAAREARRHHPAVPSSADFATFSDYQLRDVGYVREPGFRPRNHLMWM